MNTFDWKTSDWTGKNLLIGFNGENIGSLTFNTWHLNAEYNSEQRKTKFTMKGFFGQRLNIIYNGELCGEIKLRMFGNQILTLTSGEQYEFCSNIWGQNVRWIKPSGEPVVKYIQPTMTSLRRGTIQLIGDFSTDKKDILISSGLFVRKLVTQRVALVMIILMPLLTSMMK